MAKKIAKPTKRRAVKKTIFVGCEGLTGAAFLNHLKSIYTCRAGGISITIRNVGGGSPYSMLTKIARMSKNLAYDKRCCFIDNDIELNEDAKLISKEEEIELLYAKPCLEGLLLDIKGHQIPISSIECKRQINTNYPQLVLMDKDSYKQFFSEKILNQSASKVPELKKLLELFQEL